MKMIISRLLIAMSLLLSLNLTTDSYCQQPILSVLPTTSNQFNLTFVALSNTAYTVLCSDNVFAKYSKTFLNLCPQYDTYISQKFSSPQGLLSNYRLGSVNSTNMDGTPQKNRVLMRFDLSSIPSNAVIENVSISFNVTVSAEYGKTNWVDLHALLRDWSETSANWTNCKSATDKWSIPGGLSGVDYSSNISQSIYITNTGLFSTNGSDLNSDVQRWIQNPYSNFGWIIISRCENVRETAEILASRESITNSPTLSITLNGSWRKLSCIAPSSNNIDVFISTPITNKQNFYRIMVNQ